MTFESVTAICSSSAEINAAPGLMMKRGTVEMALEARRQKVARQPMMPVARRRIGSRHLATTRLIVAAGGY